MAEEAAVHTFNLDRQNREIWLVGEHLELGNDLDLAEPGVEYRMASRFIKNLRILMLDSDEPILIHMKTCGGIDCEGFAIYDAIRLCPCQITILSYTYARSMSSIILQAADDRVLMPSSTVMLHMGDMWFGGQYQQAMSFMEFEKSREQMFLDVYIDAMKEGGKFEKWSPKRIDSMLREKMQEKTEVYLTAEEAVQWGLADSIFDGDWGTLKGNKG